MDKDTLERFERLAAFFEAASYSTLINTQSDALGLPFSKDHYEGAAKAYKFAAKWLWEEIGESL